MTIFQSSAYFESFGITPLWYEKNPLRIPYEKMRGGGGVSFESTLLRSEDVSADFISSALSELKANQLVFRKITGCNNKNIHSHAVWKKASQDYLLDLRQFHEPTEYLGSMGKKTRQHLKNYRSRLNRACEFDSLKVFEMTGNEHNKDEFYAAANQIYEMNELRCIEKGFHAGTKKEWIDVAYKSGKLVLYRLNDRIIAGTLMTYDGNQAFLHSIAHDPQFDNWNIGSLVLLDTISYAINDGILFFHFLWGECEYKTRFLAVEYPLYDLIIYRKWLPYIIAKEKAAFNEVVIKGKNVLRPYYRKIRKMKSGGKQD